MSLARARWGQWLARQLALFALLLQCLAPVLAQAMPLTSAAEGMAVSSHPAHCPHHPAAAQSASHPTPGGHGQGLCCGTAHCVCTPSVVAASELHLLPGREPALFLPPEQAPATAAAFNRERLRPPDPLRNG